MKKVLLVLFAVCLMLAVSCKKEKELDQLANTTWESGHYNENTGVAVAHGIVYYGDGDACHEKLEFTDYGCVWRHLTYQGMEIDFIGLPEYEIIGNSVVIADDTAHTFQIEGENIVKYFSDGRKDGVFHRIK